MTILQVLREEDVAVLQVCRREDVLRSSCDICWSRRSQGPVAVLQLGGGVAEVLLL